MSLLSSFLSSHLIPALETALIEHEPDVQAAILGEIEAFSSQIGSWLTSKLSHASVSPSVNDKSTSQG